jgi:hypothetical protein
MIGIICIDFEKRSIKHQSEMVKHEQTTYQQSEGVIVEQIVDQQIEGVNVEQIVNQQQKKGKYVLEDEKQVLGLWCVVHTSCVDQK